MTSALAENPAPVPRPTFHFNYIPSRKPPREYPWHHDISTTIFWMGNAPLNPPSAWSQAPGGEAHPTSVRGLHGERPIISNPFYVALPFNDLAHPQLAAKWLPSGWRIPTMKDGRPQSSCKGRWIEMKNADGKICFAQWEDVGPLITDDPAYVFGKSRPRANHGLDVSLAVAKYLGFTGKASLSWRFVDDEDVLPGQWLRFDEQDVLFGTGKERS